MINKNKTKSNFSIKRGRVESAFVGLLSKNT